MLITGHPALGVGPGADSDISELIGPAAVVPEAAARDILVELALRDTVDGGLWSADPARWARYDMPWRGPDDPGDARLLGSIGIMRGPGRGITIHRATITAHGARLGWTVETLCDAALSFGGLTLATCPRARPEPLPPAPDQRGPDQPR